MRLHDQNQLWRGIARDIRNNHIFRPTRKQCREKWNALKSGYENLERLINRNPEKYPTRTPTLHDERFHQELSDEFWRVEPLVRAARRNRMDRRTYEYRERRRLAPLPATTESAGGCKPNETTDSDERVAIRSPVRSPDNDNDDMDFQYDQEEESDNEYNYEEEEEEEDNNENNDEEEEDEGNNDDNNNQVEEECNNDEEERNYDEEERNNEEEEIHQIVEALDEDKIPFCNGQFAPYFDNYTTTALFCWLHFET
ncbi:uncharacterized protein OCT59_017292 [Rhizophagus irregularis]|uniref:uncharacterized protein n=1 Tax=Rhizophagus irregularis TaxID=588596 RepID=UPI0033339E5D|nr:hypothetical protein OCT59_017292 [Rhizophagus irregularis]